MDSTKYLYKEIGAQSKLAYQLKTSYGTHSNPSSIIYTILHIVLWEEVCSWTIQKLQRSTTRNHFTTNISCTCVRALYSPVTYYRVLFNDIDDFFEY